MQQKEKVLNVMKRERQGRSNKLQGNTTKHKLEIDDQRDTLKPGIRDPKFKRAIN